MEILQLNGFPSIRWLSLEFWEPWREGGMWKACLCAGKWRKRASPGLRDKGKWRKGEDKGGDKVISLLDKLHHDLRKIMSRKKFLAWEIRVVRTASSGETQCVYSFRQVNSDQALYLIEIFGNMEDHYPTVTKHSLLCALDWWVIFVLLNSCTFPAHYLSNSGRSA